MNIKEIKTPITAAILNESLAKRYGTKIDISKFTLPQLEDARNKIRTMLKDIETNESFDAVKSESYQKSKLFLDVLKFPLNKIPNSLNEEKSLVNMLLSTNCRLLDRIQTSRLSVLGILCPNVTRNCFEMLYLTNASNKYFFGAP